MKEKSKRDEEAKESAKIAKKNIEERMSKQSPITGLIHFPDGHREFPEGGIVGGANHFLGKNRHSLDMKP
jgi:hypothetical protein